MKGIAAYLKYSVTALILLGLLTGCGFLMGPEATEGNVTIQLGSENGGVRGVDPGIISTLHYELEFKGPEGREIKQSVPQGTDTLNLILAFGEWIVTAEAYNPGNVLTGMGKKTLTVSQGGATVLIPMGSSNANLSGIAIAVEVLGIARNPLTLTPAFSSGETSYTASPTLLTLGSHFQVTATLSDPDAGITMDGVPVSSDVIQEFDGLVVGGQRTVSIVVSAQDGITTKTYTVTVKRII
jgi:hypothetical protein